MDKILEIKNLETSFDTYAGEVQAVRDVSFELYKGETLAIVGESGCGKSVTAKSIIRLNPQPPSRYKRGEILLNGEDVLKKTEAEMLNIRGGKVGMIFQDPMTSLNPTMAIGKQVMEGILRHQKISKKQAKEQALEMLKLVKIPDYQNRFNDFPHQFSGGMRQRVMIAIALACKPQILIADEPTTALDVTIQAQILDLIKELQEKLNMSVIIITHDLGVVAHVSQRIQVMYGGKIIESGTSDDIFYHSRHPYTWGLMQSIPHLNLDKSQEGLASIEGTPPDLFHPPKGCPFAARCEYAMEICYNQMPVFFTVNDGHKTACWLSHADAPKVKTPEHFLVESQ
ncbi:MAG: ABC transporter ATP-binding protein [Spirochaetes bacterium]|nr:ABC transporter ATP-binding protein [Spirochaetota bacterium]